jgi:hypothetical protein
MVGAVEARCFRKNRHDGEASTVIHGRGEAALPTRNYVTATAGEFTTSGGRISLRCGNG